MPHTLEDEDEARAAHDLMAGKGHAGFLRYIDDARSWADWVHVNAEAALGKNIEGRGGVSATQLKAVIDGRIVGRVSVRFELSEHLFRIGGHIGYYLLPQFRGSGHGTQLLRQSLIIARARGVGAVLIICEDDNGPSAAVAGRCGGILEVVVPQGEGLPAIRRYWIT